MTADDWVKIISAISAAVVAIAAPLTAIWLRLGAVHRSVNSAKDAAVQAAHVAGVIQGMTVQARNFPKDPPAPQEVPGI